LFYVQPFITALGYDINDPSEVVPEFTADTPHKNGEKIDFAIMSDGQPVIMIECKGPQASLNLKHSSQLYRYFSTQTAKVAILTNGTVYKFYSDIEAINKMDEEPFLTLNLLDLRDSTIAEVDRFSKDEFELEKIRDAATSSKRVSDIQRVLGKNFIEPSDEFISFFANQISPNSRETAQFKARFKKYVKDGCLQFVDSIVHERFARMVSSDDVLSHKGSLLAAIKDAGTPSFERDEHMLAVQEALDGYNIIRAILTNEIPADRLILQDHAHYSTVVVDNNRSKIICRLNLQGNLKSIVIGSNEDETLEIDSINELFKHSKKLVAAAKEIVKDCH
jgi:hypothetical protein